MLGCGVAVWPPVGLTVPFVCAVGKASVNIVSSRESGLTAHSREGSIYENFAPLEELVNAVTESANSTSM